MCCEEERYLLIWAMIIMNALFIHRLKRPKIMTRFQFNFNSIAIFFGWPLRRSSSSAVLGASFFSFQSAVHLPIFTSRIDEIRPVGSAVHISIHSTLFSRAEPSVDRFPNFEFSFFATIAVVNEIVFSV